MRRFVRCVFVFSSVAAAGVANAFSQPACVRVYLQTMLDKYLSVVIKHDITAAPLVVGFRQTDEKVRTISLAAARRHRPGAGARVTLN